MSKRKKPDPPAAPALDEGGSPAVDTQGSSAPASGETEGAAPASGSASREPLPEEPSTADEGDDIEVTVNLAGETTLPGRDDLDEPTVSMNKEPLPSVDHLVAQRKHLRGLVEALVFASDAPIKPADLARLASAPAAAVKDVLGELQVDYATRGIRLDEVAGGWQFRTSAEYAPFVRDLTKQKPVRLSRAQVETLAIIAYRQPITRPEIDDVRGVDSGPVLKVLLERDLVRILGKRDEPGRPLIYGTTHEFLEFFGLKSLKDLPTLREFTELSEESREAYEDELGEPPNDAPPPREEGDDDAKPAHREGATDDGRHGEDAETPREDVSHVEETIEEPIDADGEDHARIEAAIAEVIEGTSRDPDEDEDEDEDDDDDDDDEDDEDDDDDEDV